MEIIRNHLPALVVVTPLFVGLVTAIVGRRGLGWWLAMGTSLACAAMSLQLLHNVLAEPDRSITYLMGN